MTGYQEGRRWLGQDVDPALLETLTVHFEPPTGDTPTDLFRGLPEGTEVPVYDNTGKRIGVAILGPLAAPNSDGVFNLRIDPQVRP